MVKWAKLYTYKNMNIHLSVMLRSSVFGTLLGTNLLLLSSFSVVAQVNRELSGVRDSLPKSTLNSISDVGSVFGNDTRQYLYFTNPESEPILKLNVPVGLGFGSSEPVRDCSTTFSTTEQSTTTKPTQIADQRSIGTTDDGRTLILEEPNLCH